MVTYETQLKPTGIIKRIDDLGRVAVPKMIWQEIDIHEDDAFEIFTSDNGSIIFRKVVETQ